jgi:sulfate adenylyltransferase subunit 1
MVTGASTANAALILIDARKGVTEQTKRHSYISSLLQIPHLIICINKMDLVNYDEEIFKSIIDDYESLASKMSIKDIRYIPISALNGDNVVNESTQMDWYKGSPLLDVLENIHISSDINKIDSRFPVQTVIRPQRDDHRDYRGYAGRIASGIFRPNDEIVVLPSGFTSRIKTIDRYTESLEEAADVCCA